MASLTNMTGSPPQQLPSFEDRKQAHDRTISAPETCRIRWALDGPLETAISLIQPGYFDPADPIEPYYHSEPGPEPDKIKPWHPLSQCLFIRPPVSSVTLSIRPLDNWDWDWVTEHRDHTDIDDVDDLHECCGSQRPGDQNAKVLVKASSPDTGVTIHDVLATLHPYLLTRRADILTCLMTHPYRLGPEQDDAKLMAYFSSIRTVTVTDEAGWLGVRQKPKPAGEAERERQRQRYANVRSIGNNNT